MPGPGPPIISIPPPFCIMLGSGSPARIMPWGCIRIRCIIAICWGLIWPIPCICCWFIICMLPGCCWPGCMPPIMPPGPAPGHRVGDAVGVAEPEPLGHRRPQPRVRLLASLLLLAGAGHHLTLTVGGGLGGEARVRLLAPGGAAGGLVAGHGGGGRARARVLARLRGGRLLVLLRHQLQRLGGGRAVLPRPLPRPR